MELENRAIRNVLVKSLDLATRREQAKWELLSNCAVSQGEVLLSSERQVEAERLIREQPSLELVELAQSYLVAAKMAKSVLLELGRLPVEEFNNAN